jgi:hypothetical protein
LVENFSDIYTTKVIIILTENFVLVRWIGYKPPIYGPNPHHKKCPSNPKIGLEKIESFLEREAREIENVSSPHVIAG